MNNRLKFKKGDKVFYSNIFDGKVKIGVVLKIDRRRCRPYKIDYAYGYYAQSDLREYIDANDLMKKLIDK